MGTGASRTVAGVNLMTPHRPARDATVAVGGLSAGALHTLQRLSPGPSQWAELLSVRVADSGPDAPPVLGTYAIAGERIVFSPRFPFVPGVAYVVRFDCTVCESITGKSECADSVITTFTLDTPDVAPSTTVTAVFPSADELPENVLKFYVYFSQPMRAGRAFENVFIVDDASGERIPDAFVETTPELWDADMTRLTVICHPGRIKRGLTMRGRAGPPLREGRAYRLVVGADLRDTFGLPLAHPYEKKFRVGAADRTSPAPGAWTITTPRAGSRDPLRVGFGESMDHALAERMISVRTESGSRIRGRVVVVKGEREWRYAPQDPWPAGGFEVVVHSTIEDLAGNRVDGLFDAPTGEQPALSNELVRLPFAIETDD